MHAAKSERLVYLDRLRVLATIDIVSNHAAGEYLLGGIGLPVFLLTSVAMSVRRPRPPSLRDAAETRTRAILGPWIFWSAVYLPCVMLGPWASDNPWGTLSPAMLLYGPVIHLWFLPFIVPANLGAVFLTRLWIRTPVQRVIVGAAWIGLAVLLLSAYLRMHLHTVPPFHQWLFSAACIPLGIAVGRTISLGTKRQGPLAGLAAVAAVVMLIGMYGPRSAGLEWNLLTRFGMALLSIGAACMWTGRADRLTPVLVRNSFGIYLLHPMIIMAASALGWKSEILLVETLAVYLASLAAAMLLRQTPLRRVL